jgi:hypothetical protein
MAEYGEIKAESKSYITEDSEEDKGLLPDSLGLIVQELYQVGASDSDRKSKEEIWESGWHAMRGEFPDTTSKAIDVAKERGIYVNLTKRKVHEARTKLLSSTLQAGKVPFKLSPTRRPRFVAPDLLQSPDPYDEATNRAKNCEQRIRDILDETFYEDTLSKAINEMTLYGTGVSKSIVLKKVDYPLYQTVDRDPMLEMIEEQVESEMVPHIEWISIWDIFPSPGATGKSDLDWVIQRRFLSAQELRMMAIKSNGAIDPVLIESCIETGEGQTVADTGGISPRRFNQGVAQTKNFTVLELWHRGLGKEDIEPYMEIPTKKENEPIHMPVVITVLGSKVLRAIPNPFDGRLPYDFCYWQEQEDSIWGSGIYEAIRDDQDMMNFVYGMIVEGKTMASLPMVALNPNAFDAKSDDFYQMYAGKIWRLKAGESVNDAFKSVIIPDVTGGLVELLKIIERNTDLASGQVPIGMGAGAQYQTKTATGMQILNENANKLTSGVVRSLNNMITANVQAVYHWLMADSKDVSIKGDFLCLAKSYDTFMAKEVTINQVLQLIQVVGQVPEMRDRFNFEKLAVPLKAGLGLEIDGLIKSEEESAQDIQQAQAQMQEQQQQAAKLESDVYETKAVVDEKKLVAADIRKGIIQERLAKIKEGDPNLQTIDLPKLLGETSILLQEQMALMQQQNESIQQEQQQQQAAEQEQQSGQGEAGIPPESSGRPEMDTAL